MSTSTTNSDAAVVDQPEFAAALRAGTMDVHSDAEGSSFMETLMKGLLPIEAAAALTAQLYYVYDVLEEASTAMAADPVAGPFVDQRLARVPSLAADLGSLVGPDWRTAIPMLPATQSYRERLRAVAFDEPTAFIAHHYTRYLGDLSGGQAIGAIIKRTYNLDVDGVRFYSFPALDDLVAYKRAYRDRLNALNLEPEQAAATIAEVRTAYNLNGAVLRELSYEFSDALRS